MLLRLSPLPSPKFGGEQARSARKPPNFPLLKPYARPSLSLRLPDFGGKKYHGTGDKRAEALYNEIGRQLRAHLINHLGAKGAYGILGESRKGAVTAPLCRVLQSRMLLGIGR